MISNYVLIIGAMKSGTTTLFDYLAQHPQIATSSIKELGFFAFEEKWALGFEWYEQFFDFDAGRHSYAMEASTDYTKYPFCRDVARRLEASTPRKFKLIYLMRHPLRRMESHARHVDRAKKEIGQCLSPRENHSLDGGVSPVALAISCYAKQISQYSTFYENGDLLLLTLEDLSLKPNKTLWGVCTFLGIDPDIDFDTGRVSNIANAARELHPLWRALSRVTALNRLAKTFVPTRLRHRLERKASVRPHLTGRYHLLPHEEVDLLDTLKPDLQILRDKYGIDIEGQWGIRL